MTIFRAPLANNKGEVMLSMQAAGVVPAGAVPFRGLWVTINGLVCATDDTGQARKYVGGFALEDPSGLLLVTETAPASVPMDGINANVAGAVVTKTGAASLIHQGVAMTVSAPGGPLVVNKDEPALTFLAPLERGENSAGIEGVEDRDSEATYWAEDGTLRIAGVDEIRQEFQNGQPLGTLMESASTNKCTNYNADASIVNMRTVDIEDGVLSFVEDPAALQSAGLSNVVGKVYCLDNSAGAVPSFVQAFGETTNLNTHSFQCYVRAAVGTGAVGIRFDQSDLISFSNTEYAHLRGDGIVPDNINNRFSVRANPGAIVYFTLNGLEEQPVASSVIITGGAAAIRAVDGLQWSLTDSQGRNILNQSEGMAACVVRYRFAGTDIPNGTARSKRILRLGTGGAILLNHTRTAGNDNHFDMFDGTSSVAVTISGGLLEDTDYLVCSRWNQGANEKQIGFKANGTWSWSGIITYAGTLTTVGDILELAPVVGLMDYPATHKDAYLWAQDKNTSWLESFFSGVAN